MADPISISGIVISVIQLVDVGVRFCREAREIYHVGSSTGNKDVQTTTSAFVQATRSLQDELSPFPLSTPSEAASEGTPSEDAFKPHEKRVLDIAQKCNEIGSELENKLQSMELNGRKGRMRSLRQAGKNIWNKRKIEATAEQLDKYRLELQTQAMLYFEKRRVHDAKKMLGQQKSTEASMNDTLARMEGRLKKIEQNQPTVEHRILSSFLFEGISTRSDTVATAHISTCRWIFEELSTSVNGRVDFTRWLESESGMFWISGKAGSGKSTLVKHICCSERTTTALGNWSQQYYLMTAAFFAWSSGTSFDRTEHGFCRSVLHQLLSGRPDLIERVLPTQYQNSRNGSLMDACQASKSEFREALAQLARLTSEESSTARSSLRICIFLDGLDELEGGLDLARFLQDLTRTHHGFKVVLSGRPLNEFNSIFQGVPQIRVQDLTLDDIRHYTESSMKSDATWCEFAGKEKTKAKSLLKEVITKADGVFLWVALVVGALKGALEEGDTITELFAVLDELPNELEALYQHMFEKMRPRHRQQAAQYFCLAETFRDLYPDRHLGTFLLALTEEKLTPFINNCLENYIYEKWKFERCTALEKRIKVRCCGLLEIHLPHMRTRVPLVESQVQYLHKSVVDFLAMERPKQFIMKAVKETKFDADLQLAKAHLLQLRGEIRCEMESPNHRKMQHSLIKWTSSEPPSWIPPFENLLMMMRARKSLQTENTLSLLEQMVLIIRLSPLSVWRGIFEVLCDDHQDWRSECSTFFFAIQAGLAEAVQCELGKLPKGSFPPSSFPWLKLVYCPMLRNPWRGSDQDRLDVAELLVRHGARLSEVAGDFTRLLDFPPAKWTLAIPQIDLRQLAKIESENKATAATSNPHGTEIGLLLSSQEDYFQEDDVQEDDVQEDDVQEDDVQEDDVQEDDSDWLILEKGDIPGTRICDRLSKQQRRTWDRLTGLLPA